MSCPRLIKFPNENMRGSSIFRLVPDGLISPKNLLEWRKKRDGWARHYVLFLEGPFKDTKGHVILEGKFPSLCVSFAYTANIERISDSKFKIPDPKETAGWRILDPKGMIEMHDLQFMGRELGDRANTEQFESWAAKLPLHNSILRNSPEFAEMEMEYRCDYFRQPFETIMLRAMPNQKIAIRQQEPKIFKQTYEMLMNMPWQLCFAKWAKPLGLKEMTYQGFNDHRFAVKKTMVPMMPAVVRLYSYMKHVRESGDTLFRKSTLIDNYFSHYLWGKTARACRDTPQLMQDALIFLTFHAVEPATHHPDEDVICFPKDLKYCRQMMNNVHRLAQIPTKPLKRQGPIPCRPSRHLSDDQKAFIHHVQNNPVTILVGGPGTGKSECLVALMALYQNPLCATYIGMMVDALQKRFGGRPETVNTIHSIYYAKELCDFKNEPDVRWLSKFDLIIIDETSNVDEHLFSKLLIAANENNTRLVCVGDLGQIYPISPGCPFRDLIQRFPQHVYTLKENKRVDPDARELADASVLINENRIDELPFRDDGPLRLIEDHSNDIIEEEVKKYGFTDIMRFQAVVLRNVDRKHLNKVIESVLLSHNILKRGRMIVKIKGADGSMELFVGKKIAFTKNIKGFEKYSGVRNGELGRIKKIKPFSTRSWSITLHNGKKVMIADEGVDPRAIPTECVCAGYATTCNKAQGSEWNHILFWAYQNPVEFFTREFPYVAVSRAKKTCTIVSNLKDLRSLCARRATPRSTLFSYFLTIEGEILNKVVPYEGGDEDLEALQHIMLLPLSKPAVPLRPIMDKEDLAAGRTKAVKIMPATKKSARPGVASWIKKKK